ncbi:hypothetical protein PPYR_04194 [Photinus pyralis]|uniref:Spaetzle domain-containing protein n=1 Tax=Photinus pyralis TaxID=7054 RepID=A0A5N4AXM2_PHOPY|nr:uncharacterized protein LOC116163637 [Photinus pyralis]XP_031334911.1 uncharacterized protein LOC116164824 [Photinus pyralis]KAB0801998.1 hypothetical protein PPYR_04184 [Photinus pyralis]KAB0802008.1 hypothetical protein PPYR_04194 [Photinus pyralis]
MNILKIKNVTHPLFLITVLCLMWIHCQKIEFPEWDTKRDVQYFDTFMEKPLCAINSVNTCEDERNVAFFNWLFKNRKENSMTTQPFSTNKFSKSIRTVPLFQKKGLSCACKGEPEMKYLGIMYFPRQLPTIKCKPSSCLGGPYQCRPKEYKVHVLKQKQAEDLDVSDATCSSTPHSVRDFFIPEEITITVACECAP